MTWQIPTWYGTILLALATYRVWRIVAEDTILDRPRNRYFPADTKRTEFVSCPYCCGFWLSLIWWLAFIAWPHWTIIVAVPFAISAIVGLVAANLDPD